MKKIFILFVITISLFSSDLITIQLPNGLYKDIFFDNIKPLDCKLIENKVIVCKYKQKRDMKRKIDVTWIDPYGMVDRHKLLTMKEYDSYVFDYRYLKESDKGEWKVIFDDEIYGKYDIKLIIK